MSARRAGLPSFGACGARRSGRAGRSRGRLLQGAQRRFHRRRGRGRGLRPDRAAHGALHVEIHARQPQLRRAQHARRRGRRDDQFPRQRCGRRRYGDRHGHRQHSLRAAAQHALARRQEHSLRSAEALLDRHARARAAGELRLARNAREDVGRHAHADGALRRHGGERRQRDLSRSRQQAARAQVGSHHRLSRGRGNPARHGARRDSKPTTAPIRRWASPSPTGSATTRFAT